MTILAALALSFFFLHRFYKAKQLETAPPYASQPTAKTQSEENQAMPAKEPTSTATTKPAETLIPAKPLPGAEETLEPVEIPSVPKQNTAKKATEPDKTVAEAIDPLIPNADAVDQPTDAGAAVGKLVEDFVAAKNLEQRLPLIHTRKSQSELENTIMNKPWPRARISAETLIRHTAERLIEYYFEVHFDNNSMGFPEKATILVQTRAEEAPKVLLEPLLDTIGGRLAQYAKTPTEEPRDFYVIMDARVKCSDNAIPNARKKSTFFLRSHNTSENLATAYANEQSAPCKAFDNPLEGLKWKNPMPAIVTLQWNTTEDDKRPFLEVLVIKAKNWNP